MKKSTIKFASIEGDSEIKSTEPYFGKLLLLYPNPVNNQPNFKVSVDLEGEAKITISDLTGKNHFQNLESGLVYNKEYKLDISQLKAGIYILSIYNQNLKKDLKAKFIKINE